MRGIFGTQVTQRVTGLFIVCALLPVAAAITVSHDRVHHALREQRVGQIRDAAANYRSALYDRLNIADVLARSAAENLESGRTPDPVKELTRVFRTVVAIEGTKRRLVAGDAARMTNALEIDGYESRLATGASVLVVTYPKDAARGVWLIRDAGTTAGRARRIALEVNPNYLWGTSDDLPYQTDICVLDLHDQPLRCSHTPSKTALIQIREQIESKVSADLEWESGDVPYLGSHIELFLKGRFGAKSWSVIASQPAEYALATVRSMDQLVLTVVMLGLLSATLLSLIQVRRILQPLKLITDATARIAARDFAVRVPEMGGDELGALARAFNTTAARLGDQFHALEAHAEVDAVLLSSVDITRVANIVLRRIVQVSQADRRLLLLADEASPGTFRFHSTASDERLHGKSIALTEAEACQLAAAKGPIGVVTCGGARLAALDGIGARTTFALPIVVDSTLAGAIILGYDDADTPDENEITSLRELADRMAVALATAKRDRELQRRAHYDPLTLLPNRFVGLDELKRAVAAAARQEKALAVLFVDLDGFSTVNDSLGHEAGDRVLVQAASRLLQCVRKSDIVSRLGGDEFSIVLGDIHGPEDAARVAKNIIDALSRPFDIDHKRVYVSASIGIALFPTDGYTGEELLRYADLAMYQAKQKGRGHFTFFQASMNTEAQRRLLLETELRQGLERNQFELHYQPQLDLKTRKITGAEALIRWAHPVRGQVPPGEFIAFAESSPLIDAIGGWAIRTACEQFIEWRKGGLPISHVSVNVSPRQFRDPGFAQMVTKILRKLVMPAHALRLEITESAVINRDGTVEANLAALADLDIPVELDDFGTGYASLAHLRRLPVATVKLDRALIQSIETSAKDQAVVRAAIEMCHALDMTVVGEGVETAAQAKLLQRMGCDAIQGFYVGRPFPGPTLAELLHNRESDVSLAA